jgi:hypothetical protein
MSEQHATAPIPPGRYWLDVVESPKAPTAVDDWNAWVLANSKKVKVESTEDTPASGGNPHRLFVIFNVLDFVFFPSGNFGFPSFAPSTIHSEADTIKAPDPEPLLPSFGDVLSAVGPILPIILLVLVLSHVESTSRSAAA